MQDTMRVGKQALLVLNVTMSKSCVKHGPVHGSVGHTAHAASIQHEALIHLSMILLCASQYV
eukprot:2549816-Amphidinium_carterae.1